jgi:transposase
MGDKPLWLEYAACQVDCPSCGVKTERLPWSDRWQRITNELATSIFVLSKEMSWKATAVHFKLNWKTVARVVREGVARRLKTRRLGRVRTIGIDEVSRKKGHQYLAVVYDLEQRVLLWVGKDRRRETLEKFFAWLGKRRTRHLETICLDMWAPYLEVVRRKAPQALVVFDRYHLVRHVNTAVDDVRKEAIRKLTGEDRAIFSGCKFILLKNPWNLTPQQKKRLSSLVKLNNPIVRAYHLKEYFQCFWEYTRPGFAWKHLMHWRWMANHSGLKPFMQLVKLLDSHIDGVMAWVQTRVSNGALEGMNNKIKLVSHRAFGFKQEENFIAAIYHCCGNM